MGYFVSSDGLKRICRIDPDGYIYDNSMDRVGRIDADGFIYTEGLERVGRIHKDGFIYNEGWEPLGRIHMDGRVYSQNYDYLGRLDMDVVHHLLGTENDVEPIQSQCDYSSTSPSSSYGGYQTRGGYELGRNATIACVLAVPLGIMVGCSLASFGLGFLAVLIFDEIFLSLFDTMWAISNNRSVFSVAGGHYFGVALLVGLFLWFVMK